MEAPYWLFIFIIFLGVGGCLLTVIMLAGTFVRELRTSRLW
jgi:hypothetical protein